MIFYFVKENNVTNYADDMTPYNTDTSIESLLHITPIPVLNHFSI